MRADNKQRGTEQQAWRDLRATLSVYNVRACVCVCVCMAGALYVYEIRKLKSRPSEADGGKLRRAKRNKEE